MVVNYYNVVDMKIKILVSMILYANTTLLLNAQNKSCSILFLGDSYTIGESVKPTENYPSQLITELKKAGINVSNYKTVAKTGWTTGELMEALLADEDYAKYDFVFLCIGVNNQFRGLDINTFKKELSTLINYSIIFSGNKSGNVILVSIPDYGFTPFGDAKKEQISTEIDTYNLAKKELAMHSNCEFVDITPISRNIDKVLVASDGLHPSALQYSLWVKEILPLAMKKLASNKY